MEACTCRALLARQIRNRKQEMDIVWNRLSMECKIFGSPILGFVAATACWERGERRLTKSLQQACAGSANLSLVNLYIIIFSLFYTHYLKKIYLETKGNRI